MRHDDEAAFAAVRNIPAHVGMISTENEKRYVLRGWVDVWNGTFCALENLVMCDGNEIGGPLDDVLYGISDEQ